MDVLLGLQCACLVVHFAQAEATHKYILLTILKKTISLMLQGAATAMEYTGLWGSSFGGMKQRINFQERDNLHVIRC